MTKILFICGKARMRSPTAADIVLAWGGKADFAGLSHDADEQLSLEHIEWADEIYVMEARQKKRLNSMFKSLLKDKRVVSLGVPDKFAYMQPELVALLSVKLAHLR